MEPEFALQSAALNLVLRAYRTSAKRRQLAAQLGARPLVREGPTARVRQLRDSPVFGPVITDMLADRVLPHSWKHDVRERFRVQAWKRLARDRSQHFAGVQHGVNRDVTCSLLYMWAEQADRLQYLVDLDLVLPPSPSEDPRARLKVLRLLLIGGLMNPERNHRHRRHRGIVRCRCGGTQTFFTFRGTALCINSTEPHFDSCFGRLPLLLCVSEHVLLSLVV